MSFRTAALSLALLAAMPCLAATHGLQPKELATLDRYSSPTLSPDGRKLVFAKRMVDYDANKASTSLWIEDLFARDAAPPVRFTPEGWNVNSPAFSADGSMVYFLSGKSGRSQLHAMPVAGGEPRQVTDLALDIDGYTLSPDGSHVALAIAAFADCASDLACTGKRMTDRNARKASGVVFDSMFIRHWDTWADGRLNRLFVAKLDEKGMLKSATLVGSEVLGDIPSKPFGDLSDLAWAPDGKSLVFSARNADRTEPWSTNFDLWQVAADGKGKAKNLTPKNKAWDAGPVFSSDGKTLYYRAMKRPGFEADRFAIMAMDLATGASREIAPQWDRSADGITLSSDGKTIYTTAQDTGEHPLFAIDIASGQVRKLIGEGGIGSFSQAGPSTRSPRLLS